MATIPEFDFYSLSGEQIHIGDICTLQIYYNLLSSGGAYKALVYWYFGKQSGTVADFSPSIYTSFTLPLSLYDEIPEKQYGTLTIQAHFYDKAFVYLGVREKTFTVYANENYCKPKISVPIVTNYDDLSYRLTGGNTKLIRYVSTACVNVRAEAVRTNLSMVRAWPNAETEALQAFSPKAPSIDDYCYFYGAGTNTFNIEAVDFRGYKTRISYTLPADRFIEYIRPTCHIENGRPDTNGNMQLYCGGNFFNASFGAVNNSLRVEYRYKENDGTFTEWASMTASTNENTYSAYVNITGLNYQSTYTFECRATDEAMTVTSAETKVKSLPVFHWSEDDFVFEVPVTFKQGATGIEGGTSGGNASVDGEIDGDLHITGDLRLKGSGNYGNTLYFGDGSYCYLKEATDDVLTIQAVDLKLNVSNLYLNGGAIVAGSWTPSLTNAAAVSSYTTRSGWFMRMGNVVTVGFNIAASCNSGYNSTGLAISGLPFTPATNAFGGGVMFGAYVNAGFCFEAWAATTSGQITPRLQPCNNTSAGNLQIASTAYYPSGANSITLGGTITYITN